MDNASFQTEFIHKKIDKMNLLEITSVPLKRDDY